MSGTDEERLRELQARALVEAYTERFGAPQTVEEAVAALDAGKLDNLPLTADRKIDVEAWNARKEQ